MKKNKEVDIILLGNDEKDYIEAIDIDGYYYKRNEDEKLESFLGRTTWEHKKQTGVNIFPYLTSNDYGNISSMRNSSYKQEKKEEEIKQAEQKAKKKRITTSVAAAAVGIGLIGSVGCSKIDKNKDAEKDQTAKTQIEQTDENIELKNKTVDELVELLDEKSGQKDALEKIADTQSFFNEEVGPSIWVTEDKDAQLFLTEDEVLSTYIYLNLLNEGPTKLNEIFGQSDAIWINKAKAGETPIYEKLTKEQVENEFESMVQVLGNYYKWGIEPTGFTNLFENEDEQEFYAEFEELVLEFNRTGSKSIEDKIHKFFGKTFGSEQIDPLYEKYPGACALIARTAVPALKENGVVCDKGFANIMNIYRCELGDRITDGLAQMFDDNMHENELGNNNILNILYKRMDKDLVNANRNIKNSYKVPTVCDSLCNLINNCGEKVNCNTPVNCEENKEQINEKPEYKPSENKRIIGKERVHKKCKYYKKGKIKIPKYKDTFKERTSKKIIKKEKRIVTDDRDKVEEIFTEDEITEAEENANCEDKVQERNEQEEQRATDIQRGNDDAVDDFVNNNGQTGNPSEDESKDYQDQYNKTNQDLEEVKQQQEEYDRTHPVTRTEVVEEKHYDNNGNEKSTNSNSNSNSSSNSNKSNNSNNSNSSNSNKETNTETKQDNENDDANSKDATGIKRVKSVMIGGHEYVVRSFEFGESYTRVR